MTDDMRYFNVAGPSRPEENYMLPPERRFGEMPRLIQKKAYFAVHAPRQSGKTTTLMALAKRLTEGGRFAALYFSCESASAFSADLHDAIRGFWRLVENAARSDLPETLRPPRRAATDTAAFLMTQLRRWAETCPRPVVLFIDEIDSLAGDLLIAILRQLRASFTYRPKAAPWSVVLCGMRDVRDYKASTSGDPARLGTASPFNIMEESIRLPNFTEAEIGEIYGQHTAETGQAFTPQAVQRTWEISQGQPWLLNALAREIIEKIGVPPAETITVDHVEQAKERLILARATHLDSLLARLRETAVRRVIEPILSGELPETSPYDDDFQYVVDLGLIAPGTPPRIANPMYREVILRTLTSPAEGGVLEEPKSYVAEDGRLDFPALLRGFAQLWKDHGEILASRVPYSEVAPQLVLLAYLHRIVNGGGHIDREVGIGRKRIDVLVRWPYTGADGKRRWQREALELKVWRDRDKRGDPLGKGLEQIDEYLARLGIDEGTLVVFDARAEAAPIQERTAFEEAKTASGRRVVVLRA